jgi:dienelactone hydrolase
MRLLLLLLAALQIAGSARAEPYRREELIIPAPGAGAGLETMLLRLDDNQRRPLALMSHGSPRDAANRPKMTPLRLSPQALEFARRGWAVAVVMRRGYGGSGGGFAEYSGPCERPDFDKSARAGVSDLKAAIEFLGRRADVDTSRMIAVGVSAGGFATVALTADPPPGLKAAISFAGGRYSPEPDVVCRADLEAETFRRLGQRSRVPMLWVYAENDHFFGPKVAASFRDAFVGGGGTVEFIQAQPYHEDGHALFSAAGIPIWTPMVDGFLARQTLALRASPAALPPAPKPPSWLSQAGRTAFDSYVAAAPHKAFAAAPTGAYAWISGRRSAADVGEEAIALCRKPDPKRACKIVAVDDRLGG